MIGPGDVVLPGGIDAPSGRGRAPAKRVHGRPAAQRTFRWHGTQGPARPWLLRTDTGETSGRPTGMDRGPWFDRDRGWMSLFIPELTHPGRSGTLYRPGPAWRRSTPETLSTANPLTVSGRTAKSLGWPASGGVDKALLDRPPSGRGHLSARPGEHVDGGFCWGSTRWLRCAPPAGWPARAPPPT